MVDQKMSRWFSSEEKPWEIGVYERELDYPNQFSYWNGVFWCLASRSPEQADELHTQERPSAMQDERWRGLAEKPE